MPCIKVQKLVKDENGSILSGSASVVESVYNPKIKGKSQKKVMERLGKVVYINPEHNCGIFLSPTRGLIQYDSKKNEFSDVSPDDPRIDDPKLFVEPEVHTLFGDTYLIFAFLKKCGMVQVLRESFPKDSDYEKVLCHIIHGICRNGSHISCDDFYTRSFASYALPDIPVEKLGSDSSYYEKMGDDTVKLSFFQSFVKFMREKNPQFGKGCYVDSTPLPNDIVNNPFNALCSHGVASTSNQTRLILILDEGSGLPVWFKTIPGNVLDFSTIMNVMSDVAESLNIRIDDVVLDAGYVCKDVIDEFNLDSPPIMDDSGKKKLRTMLARMPAKRGYPYKELYHEVKKLIPSAKYQFDREGHTYFGYRKEGTVFEKRMNFYVYVDKDNALELSRQNRLKDPEEYEKMTISEKNWFDIRFGYFILISNATRTPAEILDDYFGRTHIETVFKTSKEYLKILPLRKWTAVRVLGKLLSDMIEEIVYLMLMKNLAGEGIALTRLIGSASSLMCMKKRNGYIEVETPNKNVKAFYKRLKIEIPSSFRLDAFKQDILQLPSPH